MVGRGGESQRVKWWGSRHSIGLGWGFGVKGWSGRAPTPTTSLDYPYTLMYPK